MKHTTLPHRFSESAFRKYEKIIAKIATRYPDPVEVNPTTLGLSGETVRGRLRDACTSYTEHQWKSDLISETLWGVIDQKQLVISLRPNGFVVAGTKESIKQHTTPFPGIEIIPTEEIIDMSSFICDPLVFIYLAANSGLKKKLIIHLTKEQHMLFTQEWDVVLEPHGLADTYLLT